MRRAIDLSAASRFTHVLLLVLPLCGCAARRSGVNALAPQEIIELDVRTASDTVARYAYVRAAFDGAPPRTLTLVRQPSGRFSGPIPAGARRVALSVSVAEHSVLETQAVLPAERPARFRIRPRPLMPSDSITFPRVLGDFNGFRARPGDSLRVSPDGRLRAAIPFSGDSTRFQIRGVGGPSDAAWVPVRSYAIAPDTSGEVSFAGVMRPRRDTLFFELDTAQLRFSTAPSEFVTLTADSALNQANALAQERFDAFRFSGVLPYFRHSVVDSTMARAVAHARGLLASPQDPRVRTEALVTIVLAWRPGSAKPSAESRALLAENEPESAITRDRSGVTAITNALFFADQPDGETAVDSIRWQERYAQRSRKYLLATARDQRADSLARRSAYMSLAFNLAATKAKTGLDAVLEDAMQAFPADPDLARLPDAFGSRRILKVGISFPSFRLTALGEGATEISNDNFRGKLTLIDFWATWCSPCIAEMPVLHRTYERFKDRGFTILSVSADASVLAVEKLRRDKWPMPWLHAWSGDGLETPALKTLGVLGLPTAVLVDAEGRIVAVNDGLRGDALERTLERLLPK